MHNNNKNIALFEDINLNILDLFQQVLANKNLYTDTEYSFEEINGLFKRGDIIGVTGKPCRSNSGELSIQPVKLQLLSPCLHMLPSQQTGLKDQETRYRKRYLDLIMNNSTR